jgi:hypothetical protein
MAQFLGRQRRPAGERRAGAENAVGPHHALRQVGDVHRPALAAARAGRLAVDLGHHLLHVDTLGNAVAMAAMRRGDPVIVVEMHHDPGRRGLFPGIEMDEAGDVAAREVDMQPLLEFADGPHDAIGFEQPCLAQRKWVVAHLCSPPC